MIQLREITKENFKAVIDLKIKDTQEGMLSSNLFSLAQSKVDDRLVPLGIYYNDDLLGFVLLEYFDERVPNYVFIKRYMIGAEYQGKGYGKKALRVLIDHLQDQGFQFAELMHYPENELAEKLYSSMGFESTGFTRDGEPVRRLFFDSRWDNLEE